MRTGRVKATRTGGVLVLVAVLFALTGCGQKQQAARHAATTASRPTTTVTPKATTTVPSASTTTKTTNATVAPQSITTAPSPPATAVPPGSGVAAPFPYLPLFPFANLGEVDAWQAAYRAHGQDPWHLNAADTALAFARFLGYTNVDQVVGQSTDAAGAHVYVGWYFVHAAVPAARVHLVRYGSGSDAPWEVVGTETLDFAVTTPASGTVVASPVTVGGLGGLVDPSHDSIRVEVTQLHANAPLGGQCCVPGVGAGQPWHMTVSFAHPSAPVLIVSASIGGRFEPVEGFAVVGVRAG